MTVVSVDDPAFREAIRVANLSYQAGIFKVPYSVHLPVYYGILRRRLNHQAAAHNIVGRLCRIIVTAEAGQSYEHLCGAKWFFQQLVQHLDREEYDRKTRDRLCPFIDLLEGIIENFENSYGNVDPQVFGKLVLMAEIEPDDILYGECVASDRSETYHYTPADKAVSDFAAHYLWRGAGY